MQTVALILTVILGDPETGPAHEVVVRQGLTLEACEDLRQGYVGLWLGTDTVGMRCE